MKLNSCCLAVALACTYTDIQASWNPNYPPYAQEREEWVVSAQLDYLLFFPNMEGLSYGSKVHVDILMPQLKGEKDAYFDPHWSSGVRAGLGFKLPGRSWDLGLKYTHFDSLVKKKLFGSSITDGFPVTVGDILLTAFAPIDIGGDLQRALYSSWKLNFNHFDIDLGREVFLSQDVRFKPYFGARILWLNHHWLLERVDNMISAFVVNESTGKIVQAKNQYRGGGPMAGFDLSLELFNGISLFGFLSGSVLWGHFKLNEKIESMSTSTQGMSTVEAATERHSHSTKVFNIDLGLGVEWTARLNCKMQQLCLRLGWEQHLFSHLNQIQDFNLDPQLGVFILAPPSIRGDLPVQDANVQRGYFSLSGIVLGASYLF